MSDSYIHWLDVLKENHLELDFKNNELYSSSENIAVFTTENLDIKPILKINA